MNPALYDSYTGQYQLTPIMILTVTREGGRLMTQATGQGKIEMLPESETKFFNDAIDAEITFVKDEKGRATELVLRQGGGERRALRIK